VIFEKKKEKQLKSSYSGCVYCSYTWVGAEVYLVVKKGIKRRRKNARIVVIVP
jgi:hypothetical protein